MEPFIHDGFVSLKMISIMLLPLKILRDTGSSWIIDGYFTVFR